MSAPTDTIRPFAVVFDTETTGVDVWNDRIVTAFIATIDTDGEVIQQKEYLVNPGIKIPQGAIDVHGVTNEVAATGMEPAVAVGDILSILQLECRRNGLPLVGANLAFDMTLMLAEARRHLPDTSQAAEDVLRSVNVLDSLVLDKAMDKYRRGNRKLTTTAAHYGVPITEEEAHSASFDALAAGRIVLAIMAKFPMLSTLTNPPNISAELLHARQIDWRAEQQAGLQAYFRSTKAGTAQDPAIEIDGSWPILSESS